MSDRILAAEPAFCDDDGEAADEAVFWSAGIADLGPVLDDGDGEDIPGVIVY